ncbi:hypothetical protein [Bosea sp. BH3]|uniref:hypothetical protein n=1 Tax=Bosea sp. BH3 TaxID=2871701 RepID=UPI0021CB4919|nr:hypothetical protein [Bosea sp. BH3]MCU4181451.1 hypothetical protein [Bosea sp. BH3]
MSELQSFSGHPAPAHQVQAQAHQAYVIEIGETQAGLVSRRGEERYFTFIAASARFSALDGQRFATPVAAESAARLLVSPRRHGPLRLAS